jgi:kynureninase
LEHGRVDGRAPPAVLSLAALECGVATVVAAAPFGGMTALRAKSIQLSELFLRLAGPVCAEFGLGVASPTDPLRRGSQISLTHPTSGYEIVQALSERGVIGDFRAPDVLRFGFTPLYTREVDVWDAVEHLRVVLHDELWRDPRYAERAAVT